MRPPTYVFPPALVPILRQHAGAHSCLDGVPDDVLTQLVTTTFFAGLQTYETERHQIRVLFVGSNPLHVVMSDNQGVSASPVYRWKALRFAGRRPFAVRELTRLSAGATDDEMFVAVQLVEGALAVIGLAREGMNFDDDPFLKLIVPRPGSLSIQSGRDRILDYDHGMVLGSEDNLLFSAGPVRQALEQIAHCAGAEPAILPEYVDAVHSFVREMAAHGHGGILVVSGEEEPLLPGEVPFRMIPDASLVALLKLSHLLDPDSVPDPAAEHQTLPTAGESGRGADSASSHLLRGALLRETEHAIRDVGALTAIDGATILSCHLALVAFGVTLPVTATVRARLAIDLDGSVLQSLDLGGRGTRHRAGVAYADRHPGSIVFVASQDGPLSCMLRPPGSDDVLVWFLDRYSHAARA